MYQCNVLFFKDQKLERLINVEKKNTKDKCEDSKKLKVII